MGNTSLNTAKSNKNDEFYTMLKDIEKEMSNYTESFKDKSIYLNCDNPRKSNFWKYFYDNFDDLGLKSLTTTYYDENKKPIKTEYEGTKVKKTTMRGDGDFRSDECIDILKESDIVITNPPFSLFRDFVSLMEEYNKNFLIIGNMNAITYKEIYPLIKEDKIWLGYNNGSMSFYIPDDEEYKKSSSYYVNEEGRECRKFGNIYWFTNLDTDKRHKNIELTKKYKGNEHLYPKYDNYNAIEVSRVKDIPSDYRGAMGVPITFLNKYNPEQFEIIKFRTGNDNKDLKINKKRPYFRILIRRI